MSASVSVVIPAHNYGRYLGEAIESVLRQDYPSDLVELIVIDDGSSDDTAQVAARYAHAHRDRISVITQENRGYVATVNRGIEAASGELLALLDADDAWLPGKLARQVQMLADEPQLGLVFGDLIAVDADGIPFSRPTMLSWMARHHPIPRRAAARILFKNEVLESTIVMRRELASPVPLQLPIADWWLTLQAALVSEIDWVRTPVARYRVHGENMSSGQHIGTGTSGRPEVFTRDIIWKLRAMRLLDLTSFDADQLAYVWAGVEESAGEALRAARSAYVDLTAEVELDERRAEELSAAASAAERAGELQSAAQLLFQSLLWDPYRAGGAGELLRVAQAAQELKQHPPRQRDVRQSVRRPSRPQRSHA